MKFYQGVLKPYRTLRNVKPSVYYLEEFSYKVIPIRVDTTSNIFTGDENITTEGKITLNFPEFLDVASNLNLVKSVHTAFDMFLGDGVTYDSKVESLIHTGKEFRIGPRTVDIPEYPEGMLKVFFGYRYTPVRDPNKLLDETDSLCCRKIAELPDDCYTWVSIDDNLGLKVDTNKPTVCKYKVEIDLQLLLQWMAQAANGTVADAVRMFSRGQESVTLNLIAHPPYQGRMSFKDNLKILYPNKTVKLKIVDRVVFRTNKSYVKTNSKLYEVLFIDNDTDQTLFKYNSDTNSELFSAHRKVDGVSQINSYMDEEVKTFEDGIVVEFKIPSAIQGFLTNHRNYKIRIVSRDLTTQNRG